jgi:hypothetical protein
LQNKVSQDSFTFLLRKYKKKLKVDLKIMLFLVRVAGHNLEVCCLTNELIMMIFLQDSNSKFEINKEGVEAHVSHSSEINLDRFLAYMVTAAKIGNYRFCHEAPEEVFY